MMLVSMIMMCDSGDHDDVDIMVVVMVSVTNDHDVGIDDHEVR